MHFASVATLTVCSTRHIPASTCKAPKHPAQAARFRRMMPSMMYETASLREPCLRVLATQPANVNNANETNYRQLLASQSVKPTSLSHQSRSVRAIMQPEAPGSRRQNGRLANANQTAVKSALMNLTPPAATNKNARIVHTGQTRARATDIWCSSTTGARARVPSPSPSPNPPRAATEDFGRPLKLESISNKDRSNAAPRPLAAMPRRLRAFAALRLAAAIPSSRNGS